ncbi:MAG: hypothetical protein DHS20C18_19820 [Saprospiraceae bacterium]|nr:MAG: hypothetical protein DHS20C18_19820 [Saprospiraceae bacterium]
MKAENSLKLMAYLEDSLEKEERDAFEKKLSASPELRQELASLSGMLDLMNELPQESPSPRLAQGFKQQLQIEQQQLANKPKSPDRIRRSFEWRIAAAVALLIIGSGFGYLWQHNQLQQSQISELAKEVTNTRKMLILSMLQQNSASERIQAIQTSAESVFSDPKIVAALISTLERDDNVNVRMKAAQALHIFVREKGVLDALIRTLTTDKSPEVQIALIDILVEVGARQAIPSLQNLMEKESVMHVVRGKAAEGLSSLL